MEEAARYYFARDYDQAERCCRELIAAEADHFDARHLLGVICLDRGQLPWAIEHLMHAARLRPGDGQVNYHLGTALLNQRLYEQAEAPLRVAAKLRPGNESALINLGNALAGMGRHEEAMACFRQVLRSQPGYVAAHYNMARSLAALDRLNEAVAYFRSALAHMTPDTDPKRVADVQSGLGQALAHLGRYGETLAICREIAAINPQLATWNESLVLLLLGRYEDGWRKYEGRWGIADHDPPRPDARVPDFAEIAGKRVLLVGEQGRGDIIQFARYAPLLARLGAHVSLKVYVELKPLMETLENVAVLSVDEPEPPYDIVTPLLSLPLAFGTRVETIPADMPYLRAPGDRLAVWQQRLGPRDLPRIGLAWSGAVEHGDDTRRSIALQRLAPLLRMPRFEFHAVQKDLRAFDQAWLAQNPIVRHHGDAIRDFADAAALVSSMDLVISVDTAAAHLAGALGRQVWIMLAYNADWRWLLDRNDSPWYPTARLFRQRRRGDWDGVLTDVIQTLCSGGFQH